MGWATHAGAGPCFYCCAYLDTRPVRRAFPVRTRTAGPVRSCRPGQSRVGSPREDFILSTTVAVSAKTKNPKAAAKGAAIVKVSDRTIEGLTDVFGMLADKSRLKILLALAQDGEMNVTALCELLGQSQPAVSHHLTLLRMNELVRYRRDGKHNFYHVNSALVCSLLESFFSDQGNGHKQIQFDDFCLVYKRK